MKGAAIIALMAATLLSACGGGQEPQVDPEYEAWQKSLAKRLSTTVLKLRNGDCLDAEGLAPPWMQDRYFDRYQAGFGIMAPGSAVDVAPYERPNFDESFWGRPHDGQVHVQIWGWRSDTPEKFANWHIPPERIQQNVTEGLFTPIQLWAEPLGMKGYKSGGRDSYYFDEREISQCRDYGSSPSEIRCNVVSADEQFSYYVDLEGSERTRLPQALEKISRAVESMRGSCPTAAPEDVKS